ncbi:ADP-ribosylglycohydrolase family protein [Paenibacillus sp. MER TA 81-3]|uniref:ADP-ribosylglycohydrolase family protein n=1 Tax=Paenibacillus sp. MER TA 81-3 TaxID=2939573 RepID=UPI0020412CDB|nr:ADP-ribosylglycohydrolase family protein [Paenibacillus sp. MER TA 81-3]MCM3339861.1 ADP-ribosylglycohydrolase family protein [Paenibacillus sp. MER TA 81-3]
MAGWDSLFVLVRDEIKQRAEEGADVSGFEERLQAASENEMELMSIYQDLGNLEISPEFPYSEPNGLREIRAERPSGPRKLQMNGSEEELRDKFYGAWLGRSVGCALGKPLESMHFLEGLGDNPGWKNVQLWFEGADAWPIRSYTPGHSRAKEELGLELAPYGEQSQLENIRYMESDDDVRYTVLGLVMLEEKGADWDSWDIGKLWHQKLTYGQMCTAETQAYLNFARVTHHLEKQRPDDWHTKLDWVRNYLNPYREWIGAQIRVDGFAYGAAGNPELAAEFAWRDASFSHVKNGIYGEMFVGAMIAASFVESDAERIIEIGLSEIPDNCRLAHAVRNAVQIAKTAKSQLEMVERIWESYKNYNPVHTINNAALCAASLVYAQGDFERAITTAVLGWDTDCNGATVGSIMGAILGASQLPESWTSKLNDTLYAEINGFHPISISECASRSYEVFQNIRNA